MIGKGTLQEQVSANLAAAESQPQFRGDRIWLTFYLCGEPEKLGQVAAALDAEGWSNTGGWEGAFLYPKVQVDRTARAIVDIAESVRSLCEPQGVDVLNIDADSSSDVRQSQFVTLYRPSR